MRQQAGVVIALQNQSMTTLQHGHHMRGDMAGIGQHAKPGYVIRKHKLHGFTRIMRNREWLHKEIVKDESLVAVDQRAIFT